MTHAVPIVLRLRDDRAEPSLPVEIALADAPVVRDGCFEVPAIIKGAPGRAAPIGRRSSVQR